MTNNTSLAGQLASPKAFFGDFRRYAIAPVHTRFEAVAWFVWDAERLDPVTGSAAIIRQATTEAEARKGL